MLTLPFKEYGKTEMRKMSIIPATGWKAVYCEKGQPENLMAAELVGWACIEYMDEENEKAFTVIGLDAVEQEVQFPENLSSFMGYLAPGEYMKALYAPKAEQYLADLAIMVENQIAHLPTKGNSP